jgi:hypothetical protein
MVQWLGLSADFDRTERLLAVNAVDIRAKNTCRLSAPFALARSQSFFLP